MVLWSESPPQPPLLFTTAKVVVIVSSTRSINKHFHIISWSSPSPQFPQAVLPLQPSLVDPVRTQPLLFSANVKVSGSSATSRLIKLTVGPISPRGPMVPCGPAGPCGDRSTGINTKVTHLCKWRQRGTNMERKKNQPESVDLWR